MKRWIRILVVAGWVVIGANFLIGQWWCVRADMGRAMILWQSEGLEVGWVFDHPNSWRVAVFQNDPRTKDYLLPRAEMLSKYCNAYVPWVWVVVGWGVVTLVMLRVRRRRGVVRAFEVGEVGKGKV